MVAGKDRHIEVDPELRTTFVRGKSLYRHSDKIKTFMNNIKAHVCPDSDDETG
mgnify:CR=1 FL=1